MNESLNNIELRSERTRSIIGEIPPVLVRTGTVAVCIVLILLIAAAWIIPYPENISADGVVKDDANGSYTVKVFVPYALSESVKTGMPARIEVEGYPVQEAGYIDASVASMSENVLNFNDKNGFEATLSIVRLPDGIRLHDGMPVKVNVIVSQKSIINRLFQK